MVVRGGYSVGDAQAPLPDDLERTMCQLCTFLTEVEFIARDAPGTRMPEVKRRVPRNQAVLDEPDHGLGPGTLTSFASAPLRMAVAS